MAKRMAYTKLFGSILDSSVWLESGPTRLTWITMLAMADRDGVVEASVPGLAKRAGVERNECERALSLFLAPDPDSRSPEHEGRRITAVDGGWRLLNYDKYRLRATVEEAKEKNAARVRRHRAITAARNAAVTGEPLRAITGNGDVTPGNECNPIAEASAEGKGKAVEEAQTAAAPKLHEANITAAEVAREWHRRINSDGGNPGALHALHAWERDYETVAGAINQLPAAGRQTALLALVAWFWLAPTGPIVDRRVARGRATPALLAKYVSSDLLAAEQWWVHAETVPT
jgi:hypothetical protein